MDTIFHKIEKKGLTADSQHVNGGLVHFDEKSIVDLSQSEQLQNFANLWGNLIDTTHPDN